MSLFVLYLAELPSWHMCSEFQTLNNLSTIPVTLTPDSTGYLVRPCE